MKVRTILEQRAHDTSRKVKITPHTSHRSVIVFMSGLVGSGKSHVAAKIAKESGASIIRTDAIRAELSTLDGTYHAVAEISRAILTGILEQGAHIVIDADFYSKQHQSELKLLARTINARVIFVRTYCELPAEIKRLLPPVYTKTDAAFIGGVPRSISKSSTAISTVALMELIRRIPHHYRWLPEGGGVWKLKKPYYKLFADIDTDNPVALKQEIARIVSEIKK